jgi:hypothetical protein
MEIRKNVVDDLAELYLLEKGKTKMNDDLVLPFSKVDDLVLPFSKVDDLAQPFSKVDGLPCELIMLIKSYLPKTCLLFLNNHYYKKYHYLIKNLIGKNNFEKYLRYIIRRDNEFVFTRVLFDFHKGMNKIKNYIYKNVMYKKYYYFLTDYCIENDSVKCRNVLNEFLKLQGLCQNRHKKNSCIHIRWKH